uniref:Uncharacterized protein n=1 Tax=Meloidogyne javanica TaxID=6303 RepID=A0A915M6V4_MELJA
MLLLTNYFVYFNALLFTIYYASIPVDGMLNRFRKSFRNRNVAQPNPTEESSQTPRSRVDENDSDVRHMREIYRRINISEEELEHVATNFHPGVGGRNFQNPRRSTGGMLDNRAQLPPRHSVSHMHTAPSAEDLYELSNHHMRNIENYGHQDHDLYYGQRPGRNTGGAGHSNTASDLEAYRHSYSFGGDFRDIPVDPNSEHGHNGDQDRRSFQGFPPFPPY